MNARAATPECWTTWRFRERSAFIGVLEGRVASVEAASSSSKFWSSLGSRATPSWCSNEHSPSSREGILQYLIHKIPKFRFVTCPRPGNVSLARILLPRMRNCERSFNWASWGNRSRSEAEEHYLATPPQRHISRIVAATSPRTQASAAFGPFKAPTGQPRHSKRSMMASGMNRLRGANTQESP